MDGCPSDNSNSGNPSNGWDVGHMSQVEIPLAVNGVDDTASVRCCSYEGNSCESDVLVVSRQRLLEVRYKYVLRID